jgi:hypothetical protein
MIHHKVCGSYVVPHLDCTIISEESFTLRGGHGWCWGRSSKSQSIIGLGLGFEKKLKRCLSLLALDCTLKMVALQLSPQTLALKICSVVGAT